MATAKFGLQPSSKALKCQTWVLKVCIHCQGCKRDVKKVLQRINGVYTATVDAQQQRVTVTGNIGVETLIEKLNKRGKHAEIWHEKLASKENDSGKANTMRKKTHPKTGQDYNHNNGEKKRVRFRDQLEVKIFDKSPENSTNGQELPSEKKKGNGGQGGGARNGGKGTKKKGQKGHNGKNDGVSGTPSSSGAASSSEQSQWLGMDQFVGPSNSIPTRQHSVPFPQGFSVPPVYASSFSMANPWESAAPFYYVLPSSSAQYANPTNKYQETPLESFNYFSDENVRGCYIM